MMCLWFYIQINSGLEMLFVSFRWKTNDHYQCTIRTIRSISVTTTHFVFCEILHTCLWFSLTLRMKQFIVQIVIHFYSKKENNASKILLWQEFDLSNRCWFQSLIFYAKIEDQFSKFKCLTVIMPDTNDKYSWTFQTYLQACTV